MLQTSNETPSFDTEWVVDRLKQGGWNEEQAPALCDVFREVTRGLTSAADTKRLEEKINLKIAGVEGKIAGLEGKIEGLEGKIEGLRFLMIGGFTVMGLGFAMLGFLIVFKEFLFLG